MGEVVKFGLIALPAVQYGVARLCEVLGVSRSGFYAWRGREPSARACEDDRLLVLIRSIFKRSHGTCGAPRVHAELVEMGESVSQKRVARLMASEGLVAILDLSRRVVGWSVGAHLVSARGARTSTCPSR